MRAMQRALVALFCSLSMLGCSSTPPPRWEAGGTRMMVAHAYWERGDFDLIEIRPDGSVYEGEDQVFLIDTVGRIVDSDYAPFALLYDNGLLLGPDETQLGRVGVYNASPPEEKYAWVTVGQDGRVTFFDEDGEQHFGGTWRGCGGPMARTCTLVTHAFMLRVLLARQHSGPSLGIGIGVGM